MSANPLLEAEPRCPQAHQPWVHLRAAVNIFTCSVSGGLVVIPHAFFAASMIPAVCLTILSGVTTWLSVFALAIISQRTGGSRSYGEVASYLAGPLAAKMMDSIVGVFLTGVLAGSFIILFDLCKGWMAEPLSHWVTVAVVILCLLYTSPSPRDQRGSRMPSSA